VLLSPGEFASYWKGSSFYGCCRFFWGGEAPKVNVLSVYRVVCNKSSILFSDAFPEKGYGVFISKLLPDLS